MGTEVVFVVGKTVHKTVHYMKELTVHCACTCTTQPTVVMAAATNLKRFHMILTIDKKLELVY